MREAACRRASRIARASAIHGDETRSWAEDARAISELVVSVKIQARPAALYSNFQAALELQKMISGGRDTELGESIVWEETWATIGRRGWASSHSFMAQTACVIISCGDVVRR